MEKWLAGGGFVGLLTFAGFLLIRLLHILNMQISRVDVEVQTWRDEREELLEAHRRCERRVTILIQSLRRSGVEVPSEVWYDN